MMNKMKGKLAITSVLIVLPILVGVLLWNRLPDQIATHWGLNGTADGWSSKPFAVFGMPLFLLAIHWLCLFVTAKDPGNRGQNEKIYALVIWICPILSLFVNGMIYANALERNVNVGMVAVLLMGILFMAIGNYLPKCKRNRTIGIRVKWTLENEENWNATHRLGGKLWFAGGILLMIGVFLPERMMLLMLFVVIPVMVLIPILYSYTYHKKQVSQ